MGSRIVTNRVRTPRWGFAVALVTLVVAAEGLAQTSREAKALRHEEIQRSIASGIDALYEIEPEWTFSPAHASRYRYNWLTRHAMGHHALSTWAMLAAGESYQNPPLYRRLNWVLSSDAGYTYDRSMRIRMLGQLPYSRWHQHVRRDALHLTGAISDVGNFHESYSGKAPRGPGDNASGQYGVLGLVAAQNAGYDIRNSDWQRIDAYWREAQFKDKSIKAKDKKKDEGKEATDADEDQPEGVKNLDDLKMYDVAPAGWGIFSQSEKHEARGRQATGGKGSMIVRGPMTAGAVAALVQTERQLYGPDLHQVDKQNVSPQLRAGLAWLDTKFSLNDPAEEEDWYYYMWSIQSVGRATGYQTFNGIDWFRQATARMLSRQNNKGLWTGDKGPLLSTAFSVLYLSRINDPVAVGKIRFTTQDEDGLWRWGDWNNRPHDIWNFSDYASDLYEVSTTWQVASLDQPVHELIESPILYLASDEPFKFSDEQIENLRKYIQAGGLLVTNSESTQPEMFRSIQELSEKLFPNLEMKQVEADHELYSIHQHLPRTVQMRQIENGIRPLMIHFMTDISRALQSNNPEDRRWRPAFQALSNLYLYVIGRNPRRSRLSGFYTVQFNESPRREMRIARLKHSGNYDPEPNALPQLKALAANQHDIDLQIDVIDPTELSSHKMAFLTTMGGGTLSPAQATAIRNWVAAGGTLWIDPSGGSKEALTQMRKMLGQIVPDATSARLSHTSTIISGQDGPRKLPGGYDNRRVRYRYYALKTMGPVVNPNIEFVPIQDRPAILIATEDITCGLAGLEHWGIFGYSPQSSRQIVLNSILATVGNPAPSLP